MLSSIFIFLSLSLSMHACNARLSEMLVHLSSADKNGEKVKLGMNSVQGGKEGDIFRSHQNTKPDDSETEAVGNVKEMKHSRKETSDHDHIPGREIFMSSSSSPSFMVSHRATYTKESRKGWARSVLGYDSNDYDPPHQTPPIHNRGT